MPSDSDKPQPQPKDLFKYFGIAGQDIPRFDARLPLPRSVEPPLRLLVNGGLAKIPIASAGPLELLGIVGVTTLVQKLQSPFAMPANFTRCRPDKFSDEFFVERRLNGFNPGQMKRVENQPWQYVICYDIREYNFKFDKPGTIFPHVIEARFILQEKSLQIHSIEYELVPGVKSLKSPIDARQEWEWAKQLFRCAEIVFQETQYHLGQAHLNVEQYAMSYYRNIVNNPIKLLLEPHFTGLLYINKLGASDIFGSEGILPQNSALYTDEVEALIYAKIKTLNYHQWHPQMHTMPDEVVNNFFDRASIAVWEVITGYVTEFFAKQGSEIQRLWPEIAAMSADLVQHSILDEHYGTLEIASIDDLKALCIYVIYHSSFIHSWLNYKQYEDVGDVEYAVIGLWDETYDKTTLVKKHIEQVFLAWKLSQIRYNPIMGETDADSPIAILKDLLWQRRNEIIPGIPLEILMSSIHV
jgi:linolenate 9R-lipoxygenase